MPRQAKDKQPSVEPIDYENKESSGETGGELVPITAIRRPTIPEFSAEQVQHLNIITDQMTAIMDAKLSKQARRFEISQSSLIAAIQQVQQSISEISYTNSPTVNQSSQQLATQHSNQQSD